MARTALDDELDRYYAEHYDSVTHCGLAGRVQASFHRALERPWGPEERFDTVLELGATSGEHLQYVRHGFREWVMLDIRDSEEAHREAARRSTEERTVRFTVGDAQRLDGFADNSIDRLVSMCLLHHVDDPRGTLHEWRRVVRPGGILSVFLPCDPGALWRAGRALTSFPAARKKGYSAMQVRYINACDHRNHHASLRWMLEGIFADDEITARGVPFNALTSWNANLYYTFQIRKRAD